MEIVRVLEAMNELRASAEFGLAHLVEKDAGLIDRVVAKQVSAIEAEMGTLVSEAERLAAEIAELTSAGAPG